MNDKPRMTLIQGDNALRQADLTDLLETMDVREAMPELRRLARRLKPAANSVLAVADAEVAADDGSVPGVSCTPAPNT